MSSIKRTPAALGVARWRVLGPLRGGSGSPPVRPDRTRPASSGHRAVRDGASDGGMGERHGTLSKMQKLLVACEVAFDPATASEGNPSTLDLETTAMLLDDLTADELGVRQHDLSGASSILYTEIVDAEKYTICVFTLPAGAKLPLHDHPNMVVLSKVLWGQMQVEAFDRALDNRAESPGGDGGLFSWLGKQSKAATLEPFPIVKKRGAEVWTSEDGVQLTGPDDCNIHEFTAVTPCCVIDVLAPPYDWKRGRRCTYYEIQHHEDGSIWARPVRCPSDFVTENLPYSGLAADLPDPANI